MPLGAVGYWYLRMDYADGAVRLLHQEKQPGSSGAP